MSNLRFELIKTLLIDGYSIVTTDDTNVLKSELLLKDVTDPLILKEVQSYETDRNVTINKDKTIVYEEAQTGLVVLKHTDTDTTIVVEVAMMDHDGNIFYFNTDGANGTETDVLSGVIKYDTELKFDDKYIELEPSNTCWIESELGCINESDKYETSDDLDELIQETSFLEVLLNDYKGRIVHTIVDHCGGIMSIEELENLDNLEHVTATYCVG